MTEKSWYWPETGGGDGGTEYSDDEFSDNWRYMLMTDRAAQGVLAGVLNELEVTGTVSPVSVDTGAALVDGKLYRNDASLDLTVSTPSSESRKDRLVLRKDWSAQTIRATVIEGTEGSGTYPDITQTDGSVWDIIIGEWIIDPSGNITIETAKGEYAVAALSLLFAILTKESPSDGEVLIRDTTGVSGATFGQIRPGATTFLPSLGNTGEFYVVSMNENGTPLEKPADWSISRDSEGIYTITHNLETSGYIVIGSASTNAIFSGSGIPRVFGLREVNTSDFVFYTGYFENGSFVNDDAYVQLLLIVY